MFYEPQIPSGGPLGNRHLTIPTNAVPKIGKEVKGFTLVGFEEKYETSEIRGKQIRVDASILTIQRGNGTFTMRKGRSPYHEYEVRVRHVPTGRITTLDLGDPLVAGMNTYILKRVDTETQSCILTCEDPKGSIRISTAKEAAEQDTAELRR